MKSNLMTHRNSPSQIILNDHKQYCKLINSGVDSQTLTSLELMELLTNNNQVQYHKSSYIQK